MRYGRLGILGVALASAIPLVMLSASAGPAGASGFTFSTTVVNTSANAGEPGIVTDPKGAIYIDAPAGIPGPSPIWRSTDGGGTFQEVGPGLVGAGPNVTIGGGDSDLAVGGDGRLYYVDLWLADASTATSADQGGTWTGIPLGTVPLQDRPWVSADPRPSHAGTAYSVTEQLGTGLFLSETVPGLLPGTFYPVTVPEITDAQRGLVGTAPAGNMATDMNGTTYNVYSVFTGSNGSGIGLSVFPSGSLTPVNRTVGPAMSAFDQTQSFPVVAVDGAQDHNVYVVWTNPIPNGNWDIEFASSPDSGVTWTPAVTLGQGLFPWVTADGAGKVDVGWYSAALTSGYTGDPNKAPASTVWDVAFAQSTNALSSAPTFSAPVIAASGIKHGAVCTGGTGCSADRELLDFMSITHDAAGNALIAYTFVPQGTTNSWIEFAKETSGTTIN